MEQDELEISNCICGEPHMSLDIFKENGSWLCICPACDRVEYSSTNKVDLVDKWNKSIEKDKSVINPHTTLKNELYTGVNTWTRNIIARWYGEYSEPMSEDEINDLLGLIAANLDNHNNKLL